MKRHFITILICCLFTPALLAQPVASPVRINQLFNFDWKFKLGNMTDAQSVAYDDRDWHALDLPHDFQIEQAWNKSASGGRGFKDMGEGWYRKSFKADPAWLGKRVLLDFEGVMLSGKVWLNGHKVADMEFGYLGYEADITEHLNYNGENVVAVYATTGKNRNSRWYTGGGLFRDVHMVVKDSISIARHGVFITTPDITEQRAEVEIQIDLEGISNKRLDIEIQAKVFSPDGKQVAVTKSLVPQGNRLQLVEALLPAATVINPQLWSCETPNLYTAEVSLIRNGQLIDQVTETFGIRTIEYSSGFGFKLNGKKVFLKGIACHHDLGALGAAVYDQAIERLFKQLKAFGFNHVRTSHNPYSESFMKLADKYGILIVDELCDKWSEDKYWPGSRPFSEIWYKILPEWIKRDRNHPSVIMWSLGNELQMREDLTGFPTGDWGVTTYRILDVLVKRYDTTRPTTVAMFPSRANAVTRHDPDFNTNFNPPELSLVTEVASYNYQYHVYQEYQKKAPELIIYQSEASTSNQTGAFFGMDYNKMVGLAYWGAVEYWGESSGWPKKGWNYSYFNHALEPYPQAYLMKSAFVDEPLVRIGVVDSSGEYQEWNDIVVGRTPVSSHWNRKEASSHNLFTFTNADEVELFVNGKSLGVQQNPVDDSERRNIIYWKNVPYGKGGNITAVAGINGTEVARHRLETTGKAVAFRIETENWDWKADGMDLQYVKVYAVDSKGRVVPTVEGDIRFDISGEAKLIAVDNGDHNTDKVFSEGNAVSLHNGFAMAILRSTQTSGNVHVSILADGMKNAEKKLVTR
ncbi:MAG: glycoside hydrolase family 2 TIM barrel-domain containing protein [Mangrovibacterium sp.]|tara:strand:- start:16311 stop:18725 length:2415 start_codon:yes stop_codon:yes gene_type:complete